MHSHKDDKINDNFINIYSNTDTRMKELGQILKTPKSRKIYQILMDKELHTKEIGIILENSENPRLPNLTHHLKKMTKIGLLASTTKMKNGHPLTYYKAVKYLLIVPDKDIEIAKKSKTLKSVFRKVFKISLIGIPTTLSYFLLNELTNVTHDGPHLLIQHLHHNLQISIPTLILLSGIELERMTNFFNIRHSMIVESSFN